MTTFHHVNLGVFEDGIDAEAAWLTEVLDYRHIEPGEGVPPQACWFEAADGTQIHLSRDPEHRPAAKAHVAVTVDDLPAVIGRLERRGVAYQSAASGAVVICRDPSDNRWELRARPV